MFNKRFKAKFNDIYTTIDAIRLQKYSKSMLYFSYFFIFVISY